MVGLIWVMLVHNELVEVKLIPRSLRLAEGQSKVSARLARSVQSQQGQSTISNVSPKSGRAINVHQKLAGITISQRYPYQRTDGRTDRQGQV